MRKNSRWAASSQVPLNAKNDSLATSLGLRRAVGGTGESNRSERQEVRLMSDFLDLKRDVWSSDGESDIETFSLVALLSPFFNLIRSPLSTGPITFAALSALYTFFVSGFITPESPDLDIALVELSNAVSHCKFEASDASGDEVALYRIMAVIEQCMCGPVGNKLGDIEVCEMLETVLTTCCQMRLSEILRKYAESTMHSIVRNVFGRLQYLNPDEEEKRLADVEMSTGENELTMSVQTSEQPVSTDTSMGSNPLDASVEEVGSTINPGIRNPQEQEDKPQAAIRNNYGLPSILELLRVLVNILDPSDRLHTDSTRLVALRILNTAFEVAGMHIRNFPSLMVIIQDHGCRYLFQLARSDSLNVLHMSLRVVSAMLETMSFQLKLQQELFLAFTVDRLASSTLSRAQIIAINHQKGLMVPSRPSTPISTTPNPSTPIPDDSEESLIGSMKPSVVPAKGETRELLLETLNHIARRPSFMVNLFANYDCDINCEDLFEKLIDYLTKGVYAIYTGGTREASQRASQLLCLDLLLEFVGYMAARADGTNVESWPESSPDPQQLLQSKSRKRMVLTGASRFNAKPKVGLSFLEENKLIYADLSDAVDRPKSLAMFLKSCTRLDKRLLGDFISKPENADVLKAFISLFDFRSKLIAEAMRELLESFRLPGEAQQIARITETFAEVYFASQPADIKSQDAVYVLAYSIIMLNTDLHNPQVRKRMTLEDYQRNLRGVNNGTDFRPDFLNSIYESIRKREIVMPEEHTGQVGFGYAWKELLARTRISGTSPFRSCNTAIFDFAMFAAVWKQVIGTIAYAFTVFDDDYTIQRAITGFRQMATLSGRFNLPEVLDYVLVSLSQVTGLVPEVLMTHVPRFPVVEVEGQNVTVSSLSVKFGTNFKGQLAAVVLFTIINGNGDAIREGWTQIFEIYLNLFMHSLLPSALLKSEDGLGGLNEIPLTGNRPQRPPGRGDGGLLSTLSSYLLNPYGSSWETVPEATDSEVENTLCTIDCIAACKLDELYKQISCLESEAFVAAVRALEALAHERTVARLKQEFDDFAPTSPGPLWKERNAVQALSYDPGSVYVLETMVSIVSKAPQNIEETWPIAYEHLSALLSSASSYGVLLIERAVAALWRLLFLIVDKPSLRDQVYVSLDLLGNLPGSVISSIGEQVIAGLVTFVKAHLRIIRSQTEWGLVFALMRSAIKQRAASRQSYELLISLTADGPEQRVTIDNFSGLVSLLDEYATAAGVAIESVGQLDRRKNGESALELAIQRGKHSVDLLFGLKKFIPQFAEGGYASSYLWKQCSLPLAIVLGRQSTNASRDVRHTALIHLQRLLLGQQFILTCASAKEEGGSQDGEDHAEILFNRVVFPLIDELLKPQVAQRDPRGIPETRLRASVLLCKAFMQYKVNDEARQTDIHVLWIQVLDLLDRLISASRRDQMHEAISESLKNVILVMNAMDILVPPAKYEPDQRSSRQKDLWNTTHERTERFLPGFLDEVIITSPASRKSRFPPSGATPAPES